MVVAVAGPQQKMTGLDMSQKEMCSPPPTLGRRRAAAPYQHVADLDMSQKEMRSPPPTPGSPAAAPPPRRRLWSGPVYGFFLGDGRADHERRTAGALDRPPKYRAEKKFIYFFGHHLHCP
jgi:hypothetical protein